MDLRRALALALLLVAFAQKAIAIQGTAANQNGGITDPPPPANQRTVPNRPNTGSPAPKSPATP